MIPVESAMRTRRDVKLARKIGKTRRGLDAMLSSSRFIQDARIGGKETRKLAETSSASNVSVICGNVVERKLGTAFGVVELPIKRWVVPERNIQIISISYST